MRASGGGGGSSKCNLQFRFFTRNFGFCNPLVQGRVASAMMTSFLRNLTGPLIIAPNSNQPPKLGLTVEF